MVRIQESLSYQVRFLNLRFSEAVGQLLQGGLLRVHQRLQHLQAVRHVLLHWLEVGNAAAAAPAGLNLGGVPAEGQDRVAEGAAVLAKVEQDVLKAFALKDWVIDWMGSGCGPVRLHQM